MKRMKTGGMKKFILLMTMAACFCACSAFGAGSPARVGLGVFGGEPVGVTFRYGRFPVAEFGWSGFIGQELHFALDYWIINNPIQGQFSWYLGFGGKMRIQSDSIAIGARLPVGLQWFMTPDWELFFELAPGIRFFPAPPFWGDAVIGIRYYFKS